jgi:putative ABC transport system permease protein
MSIKLSGNNENIKEALGRIEKAWKQYLPVIPFEYTFLDERFGRLYESEQRQSKLFTGFSLIAIFIACLGLLGLSAFSISQRIKEIGIRKVLGASSGTIVWLLSIDFLVLVGIAAILAFIGAGLIMYNWLQSFAYRISMEWWVFATAGILAAFIALLTISFQALKAAWSNPVKSLRSE